METLVKRVEELAASLGGGPSDPGAQMSPQRLASMLKEALAANTIGGKVDVESRRRAAQEEARQAQASWSRIGHVADEERRALADRFQRALKQHRRTLARRSSTIGVAPSGVSGLRPAGI